MIKFSYYRNTGPDKAKELVARNVIDKARLHLELPEFIEVQFVSMGPSQHGETIVDTKQTNVLRINLDLSTNDIVVPMIHELIHLEQIHIGKLSSAKFGYLVWEGKKYKVKSDIAYKDYMLLPWEQDVNTRLKKLLKIILDQ